MLKLLTFVVDFLNMISQAVLNTVSSLYNIICVIPTFVTYTNSLFAYLPQPYFAFAIIGLSITVFLFVIGRET